MVGEKLAKDLETAGGFEQTLKESAQRSETRLLIKAARPAGTLYAGYLGCSPQEPLFYVKRLCLLDGEPLSLEEAYVPQNLVPNLPDVDLNVFSLHQVYAFYGIRISRGEQSLSISRLDSAEARLLDVDAHRGVLTLQCVSYDAQGQAVEFTRSHIRGDKCDFHVHFHR